MSDDAGDTPVGYVLVVDDQAHNRELLADMLSDEGHRVRAAASGEEALRLVDAEPPATILLDVAMPGMTGLEVCRLLKDDPVTAKIPVLLVTALADRQHRLAGIAAGADEYITKPVDRAELVLRVRNALRLSSLHEEVEVQVRRLRELETLRDGLVHMVVHDLRAPLTAIVMYASLLREDSAPLGARARVLLESVEAIETSARQMAALVNDVLDVHRVESGALLLRPEVADLAALAREAIAAVGGRAGRADIGLSAAGAVTVAADGPLIRRVIANLLDNALKFAGPDASVSVDIETNDGVARVAVTDDGPGIPPEHHARIFDKFGQVEARKAGVVAGSGIGLAFCKLAVELHGGRIGVDSDVGRGSRFWFELPYEAGSAQGSSAAR